MHLVVLYGYQGADADPEQLALIEQLFDAALGELVVVARGHPCLIVGDATALFQRFFDCGRAFRCLLPLGGGRFMHLWCFMGFRVLIVILSSLP